MAVFSVKPQAVKTLALGRKDYGLRPRSSKLVRILSVPAKFPGLGAQRVRARNELETQEQQPRSGSLSSIREPVLLLLRPEKKS